MWYFGILRAQIPLNFRITSPPHAPPSVAKGPVAPNSDDLALPPDLSNASSTATELCMQRPLHSTNASNSQQNTRLKRTLRLLNLNLQCSRSKKPEVENLVGSTNPDIIIATETWLDPTIGDNEVLPDDFKTFRKDRNRHGGGVLIAVRNHLNCSEATELHEDGCEVVWVRIKIQGTRTLYVCAYYRPNESDAESLALFKESLAKAAAIPNAHIIVGGDMNLPDWDWKNMTLKPGSSTPSIHRDFVDLLHDYGMEQMVDEPTRGANTLDLICTNSPHLIPRTEILPGISDHDIVYCDIAIHPPKSKQVPRLVPLYKLADWDGIRQAMSDLRQKMESEKHTTSTEKLWTNFRNILKAAVTDFIPHKRTRSKVSKPWITPQLRKLIKRRERIYKKMKEQDTEDLKEENKKLRSEIQRQLRRSYWSYLCDIFEDSEQQQAGKHKKFWTYIKHQRSSSTGVAPLKIDGRLLSNPTEQAEALNRQFHSAFSEGKEYSREEFRQKCKMPPRDYPPIDNITVVTEGIRKLLFNLKPWKAPGPDNITPRVLQELADDIAPILTIIYQSSIDTGTLPSDWKEANVTPVFKKGERYEASNYRPVSLTSICCKVLEHIFTSTIMDHLERNNILCRQQHGFRSLHSCETQLLEFSDELVSNLAAGKQTDVLVLDFEKAFDRVNHSLLVHKLHYYGIHGNIYAWIANFLDGRSQAVVVNGVRSHPVSVKSGVPQGSVLGPCLFLIYINDLPDPLTSKSRLFADDTAVYGEVSSAAEETRLQSNLDLLTDWGERWDMAFHPGKCKNLSISRKRKLHQSQYQLHGHELETVTKAKYLGVTLTNNMSWSEHINAITAKANKTLGFLKRNVKISSQNIKEIAYKTYVRPILEYASSVWDPSEEQSIQLIERVQRRAARFVLRRYRNTSSVSAMLHHLQWPSLQHRRKLARLTMLYKIRHGLACAELSEKLQPPPPRLRRGHNHQFYPIGCRTKYMQNSFLPRTIKEWNTLPQSVVEAPSLASFVSRASALK